MKRGRHLSEDRLIEFYLQARERDGRDSVRRAVIRAHLAACEACACRYAEVTGFLDAVRDETEAGDAAVFTDSRLAAQHDRIMRRIDHMDHPVQVITFPAARIAHRVKSATSVAVWRWVASGAVAGLLVGVAVGRFVDRSQPEPAATMASLSVPAARVARVTVPKSRRAASDDAFVSLDLSELDRSFDSEHQIVLQAYDALTPRIQEVSAKGR